MKQQFSTQVSRYKLIHEINYFAVSNKLLLSKYFQFSFI